MTIGKACTCIISDSVSIFYNYTLAESGTVKYDVLRFLLWMFRVTILYREDHYDLLTVCDWGQRIGHYQLSGKQVLMRCTSM